MAADPLRFGILGAARIAPMALVRPARRVTEATVLAVAARDPERARQFAARHGIPRVHPSYDALLADPEVDAIYNPLPNSLHAPWTGGALMDTGCYTVSVLRHLAGAEPAVESARGWWTRGGVDRAMEASLRFPDGRTARLTCSLFSAWLLRTRATVEGSGGRVSVFNPIAPHIFHRLRVLTPAGTRSERIAGPSTYECQLRAFVAAVRDGAPVPTGPADAIGNMRVIDAIYAAAGRRV